MDEIVRFVPYYALGNVCIGTWMFFWNSENLKVANVFVVCASSPRHTSHSDNSTDMPQIINTLSQLYYVSTKLSPMNTASTPSILTHIVSKTFAGIGVLDILHNTSVGWFKDQTPSTAVKVLTGLGFAGLSACSDWILGGCLVYDLVGLSVGQAKYSADPGWSMLLGGFAVGCAGIVAARNYVR